MPTPTYAEARLDTAWVDMLLAVLEKYGESGFKGCTKEDCPVKRNPITFEWPKLRRQPCAANEMVVRAIIKHEQDTSVVGQEDVEHTETAGPISQAVICAINEVYVEEGIDQE